MRGCFLRIYYFLYFYVFRLHIIANSDSASDQALKLKVRDRILRDAGPEFLEAKDLLDAKKITEKNLELIKNLAQDEILKNLKPGTRAKYKNIFLASGAR